MADQCTLEDTGFRGSNKKPEDIKVFVKVIHKQESTKVTENDKRQRHTKNMNKSMYSGSAMLTLCIGLSQHLSLMCVLVFSCGNTVSYICLLHTAKALAAAAVGCASLLWPMSNMTTTPWSKQSEYPVIIKH